VDVGRARFPGFPLHFERRAYEVVGAPGLGADNAAVLADLGYGADEIADLHAAGVIADQPPA
jgi:crotonobetainyl-CoA:carnitine CoA-transferase CaiB-like acyl-CoA transferase